MVVVALGVLGCGGPQATPTANGGSDAIEGDQALGRDCRPEPYWDLVFALEEKRSESEIKRAIRCLPDVSYDEDYLHPTITIAIEWYSAVGVRLLLEAGANLRPRPGSAPVLHGIIGRKSVDVAALVEILSLLKEAGYDPCWTDSKGDTTTSLAIKRGRSDLLAILRDHDMTCE